MRDHERVTSYQRPSIDALVFRDADGQIIEYGDRWSGSPPDDTYSVVTHPDRFAPLHIVADALIAYLRDSCDVEVVDDMGAASDLLHSTPGVIRAVRVRAVDPACAALTFVFTDYPAVVVHAGVLHDFRYPVCGCDACDSDWATEADRLERDVLAVVAGRYREAVGRGRRPSIGYSLTYPDGASSGLSRARDIPTEGVKAARSALRGRSAEWAAWPRRTSTS